MSARWRHPLRTLRERRGRGDEDGYTLVELLVAMGIFSVVTAVFLSGVVVMYRDAVKAEAVGASADNLRKAFTTMDRQVRYAEGVNYAAEVGGTWYAEFRTPAAGGVAAQCYQWRYRTGTGDVAYRTWVATGTAPTAWTTLATGLQTAPAAAPFTVTPAGRDTAGVTRTRQQVTVALTGARTGDAQGQLTTTFTAGNTGPTTLGNVDADHDGASDAPVCSRDTNRT